MILTNFARYPRWAAALVLAIATALIVLAQALPGPPPGAAPHREGGVFSDTRLYRAIATRVASGADYYATAADQQRAHNYPTWPPQVIREPTQALVLAALHNDGLRWAALLGLAGGALTALWRALARTSLSPRIRLWALAFTCSGMAIVCSPTAVYMHEIWASLFIVLALALRQPDRWALAICAGVGACLFRETALPFLFVMAAFAVLERQYREAAGWASGIVVFCGVFALHLWLASRQHLPGDLTSPGWVQFSGLPFIIATARDNALLLSAPAVVVAGALAASAIGFLGCPDPGLKRWAGTLGLYMGLFAVVGRMDNTYWGYLYAPLLPLGWTLAPAGLRGLATRAFGAIATKSDRPGVGARASLTSSGS
jgi:hypothetical protein